MLTLILVWAVLHVGLLWILLWEQYTCCCCCCSSTEIKTCLRCFCSMDQVKGVLTLQGEALTQAVSLCSHSGSGFLVWGLNIDLSWVILSLMFNFSQQDINLKVAKSSQVLHFQFREDKQWKLQQVHQSLSNSCRPKKKRKKKNKVGKVFCHGSLDMTAHTRAAQKIIQKEQIKSFYLLEIISHAHTQAPQNPWSDDWCPNPASIISKWF